MSPSRRDILQGATALAAVAAGPAQAAVTGDLTWTPGWRLRDMMVRREVSPVEVTNHFLARIEALDPRLHAFRQVDAEGARAQARAAEAAQRGGAAVGPLHGVPIAIKEAIRVKGMRYPPIGGPSEHDDIMVERLRAAGAVIVGTTVMPGMGNWPNQQQAYGTPPPGDLRAHPRNPWNPERVPGSSSAGSAAAAVAALVPIAIGTDGGGSTRLPAALCGVVGVHPTRGRIPRVDYRKGGFELTNTWGPICRDLRDAAIVMQATAGPDGRDFISVQDEVDYLSRLDDGAAGLRFAWTADYGLGSFYDKWVFPAVIETARRAAWRFADLGASVVPAGETWEDFWAPYQTTSQFFRSGTGARLETLEVTPAAAEAALQARGRMQATFERVFRRCDLLLSPTLRFTAPTVEAWDAAWSTDNARYPHGNFAPTYTCNTHVYNWLGWPAVSVPCGFVDGLPVGLQISAPPWREALIFRAASALMKAAPRPERPGVS